MKYIKTLKATDWPQESLVEQLIRLLLFFTPSPNRENEKRFHLLRAWLIEFDDDGEPHREIGLDKSGEPIFASDTDDATFGFWLDTNIKYEDFSGHDSHIIDAEFFNAIWEKIRPAA